MALTVNIYYTGSGGSARRFAEEMQASGLVETVATLKTKCAGASVSDGLSMRGSMAQNNRTEAKNLVTEWLEKIK